MNCSTDWIYCQAINTGMLPCFKFIDGLDIDSYSEYFLSTFHVQLGNQMSQFFQYKVNDPIIKKLNDILVTNYQFPPIEYFILFNHKRDQSIHIDGIGTIRYASLNLPLAGQDSNKMIFYKLKKDSVPIITNANYHTETDVEYLAEIDGRKRWTLVNSGIPHQVTNIDSSHPRITLCVRFYNNPSFEHLLSKLA
jgi:hypothetical protein